MWVAALSNYTFSIIYKPGKGHHDADALSHIKWPEAMEISSQAVHAVCEGVQASTWQDRNLLSWGPSSEYTGEGQCTTWHDTLRVVSSPSQGPSHQSNSRGKQKGTLGKLKIKSEMPSDLKAPIRIKRQLVYIIFTEYNYIISTCISSINQSA